MPRVKTRRAKETESPPARPARPESVDALLRELDGMLERLAEEAVKSPSAPGDPPLPDLALLAVRWLATRRLLDVELARENSSIKPDDTPWRVEDAWIKAILEADMPGGSFSSEPNGRANDPSARLVEEKATYRALLPEMLKQHEGKFVLIKGSEVIGFFPDLTTSLQEGHRQFRTLPFLVKEVTREERVVWI